MLLLLQHDTAIICQEYQLGAGAGVAASVIRCYQVIRLSDCFCAKMFAAARFGQINIK